MSARYAIECQPSGKRFALGEGTNLVGRRDDDKKAFPEVDLDDFDPDAKVSRRHALILVRGNRVAIEDLGSLNGTMLQGTGKLTAGEHYEIAVGQEIIIGSVVVRLIQTDD